VKEQWLVGIDQELIEREATRCGVGDTRRQSIDAVGDLMRAGLHRCSPLLVWSKLHRRRIAFNLQRNERLPPAEPLRRFS
jgi:hypothetical protein